MKKNMKERVVSILSLVLAFSFFVVLIFYFLSIADCINEEVDAIIIIGLVILIIIDIFFIFISYITLHKCTIEYIHWVEVAVYLSGFVLFLFLGVYFCVCYGRAEDIIIATLFLGYIELLLPVATIGLINSVLAIDIMSKNKEKYF